MENEKKLKKNERIETLGEYYTCFVDFEKLKKESKVKRMQERK